MGFSKKSAFTICAALALAAVLMFGLMALAEDMRFRPEADQKMSADLAAFSGLQQNIVLKLYDAVGTWEKVRENIFVYKRVLELVLQNESAFDDVFAIIRQYSAEDVLAVYEFLAANAPDYDKAEDLLAEHAKGTSLDTLLAAAIQTKTYRVYKPAEKEQVRAWFNQGYKPEDILKADSIALAKDLSINSILASKDDNQTWEETGKKFGHKFTQSTNSPVSVKIKDGASTETFSGKDYQSAVKEANKKAKKDREMLEQETGTEYGMTADQINEYKNQGFSVHDIRNAAKLARKSGASMDIILQERKDGKDWETIIQTYNG
jgi:hypothetical protein